MPLFLVCIDGPDFSGKTTISNLVLELLRNQYKDIIFKKTVLPSELITGVFTKILRNSSDTISPRVFALTYATDHLHHYEKFIQPLKNSSEKIVVIQERSLLTTYIYQGLVGDTEIEWIREINKYDKNIPNLTLILRVDIEEILRRRELERRGFDKFEQIDHLKKQVEVYYNLPEKFIKEFNVEYIDANDEPMKVAERCVNKIKEKIDTFFT